jgi:membrane-bound lytic murein transglycosylase D
MFKTKFYFTALFALIFAYSSSGRALVKSWKSSLPKNSIFEIDPDLDKRVDFWVKIYSHYSENQGVFHRIHSPEQILGEIDLSEFENNSVLSEYGKSKKISMYIDAERKRISKKYKISTKQFRLQMGLKERMERAFYNSGKYLEMMEEVFASAKLPIELTRIPFVESSFNIKAQSRVGASGLWQIMPSVAKSEGYIQKNYDKRNHPYYSTVLASDIFKQNYKSLKSWPLAITAYNHGLTGVRRMKKKVDSRDLVDLIESDKRTRTWGFASENFYACFLAVLEVERRAVDLFGADLLTAKPLSTKNIQLRRVTSKHEVLKMFGGSSSKLKRYNPHIRWSLLDKAKKFPAGLPLIVPQNAKL